MGFRFFVPLLCGLLLFLGGEFIYFVSLKMAAFMLCMTFIFGLFAVEHVEGMIGNLLALVMGQILGCAFLILSSRAEFPLTFLSEILRGVLRDGSFVYWFLGFPCGLLARRFMPEKYQDQPATSEATRAQQLVLRDQHEFDAVTSPSIHIL